MLQNLQALKVKISYKRTKRTVANFSND